jgi:hypothetical protein
MRPYLKNKLKKQKDLEHSSGEEYLPSNHEVRSIIPSTNKKKQSSYVEGALPEPHEKKW